MTKVKFRAKIIKHDKSLAVIIPKKHLDTLGVVLGDMVEVEISKVYRGSQSQNT